MFFICGGTKIGAENEMYICIARVLICNSKHNEKPWTKLYHIVLYTLYTMYPKIPVDDVSEHYICNWLMRDIF